jgi:hypothetical protein
MNNDVSSSSSSSHDITINVNNEQIGDDDGDDGGDDRSDGYEHTVNHHTTTHHYSSTETSNYASSSSSSSNDVTYNVHNDQVNNAEPTDDKDDEDDEVDANNPTALYLVLAIAGTFLLVLFGVFFTGLCAGWWTCMSFWTCACVRRYLRSARRRDENRRLLPRAELIPSYKDAVMYPPLMMQVERRQK